MWKYRVSFRNMINVTFVTGRRGREKGGGGGMQGDNVQRQWLHVCVHVNSRGLS